MLIGIVGKPSSGKSTFLNAACLSNAKTGNYPFTTIEPNLGSGFIRVKCVCKELNIIDQPKNSFCVNGNRYIPVKLLDVAGLVPGAHEGRGLGNKFLSDLSRADVLLHIIDISGELDIEGNEIVENKHDPLEDIKFLENEINLWFYDILTRDDWTKFKNAIIMEKLNFQESLFRRLSGINITKEHIVKALNSMENKKFQDWSDEDLLKFSSYLREISKPIVLVANKIDKSGAYENFTKIKNQYKEIIPSSALAEYYLRKYAEQEVIDYYPGDSSFNIRNTSELKQNEKAALQNIKEKILNKFGSTGVQAAINFAVIEVLKKIIVYPVYDDKKFSDKDGRVLPDAYIVDNEMELKEFVKSKIHSDLAKHFLYGIDARTKMRLGESYKLKDKDIIKIVSAAKGK